MVANGRGTALSALTELRRRWLLVATVTVAAAGAAAAYSFTAPKHYRATATLVAAPVALSDPTFLGIDVLHDTTKHTAAETAARLLDSPQVAESVRVRLGLSGTAQSLLDDVSVKTLDESNVVAVTATATDPKRAAQIANGFVDAFTTARSAAFESEVASSIKRLRGRLAALTPAQRLDVAGMRVAERLGDLRARVGTGDPTVRHGSEAVEPESAYTPHPVVWTLLAGLIGLAIGVVVASGSAVATAIRRRETAAAVAGPALGAGAERAAERAAKRLEQLDAEIARLLKRTAAVTAAEIPADESPAAVPPSDEQALSARQRDLDQRTEVLTARERALAVRAADLNRRERELDERELKVAAELTEREAIEAAAAPELGPAAPPGPAQAPPPPAAVARSNGAWRLSELERLVESNAAAYPHRVEEWRSYLFYLRDYVDSGGRLPGHFDWLIEDTFGELLVRQ
jgi:capsular polysaccharide biosynthesis protein